MKLVAYFDASTRAQVTKGTAGYGAAAAVVFCEGRAAPVREALVSLPELHTVNENEYIGLITALRLVRLSLGGQPGDVTIFGDSAVVTQQFRGKESGDPWEDDGTHLPGFACNVDRLRAYRDYARAIYWELTARDVRIKVCHILRSTHPGNARVDYLAQSESDRLGAALHGLPLRTRPAPQWPHEVPTQRLEGFQFHE